MLVIFSLLSLQRLLHALCFWVFVLTLCAPVQRFAVCFTQFLCSSHFLKYRADSFLYRFLCLPEISKIMLFQRFTIFLYFCTPCCHESISCLMERLVWNAQAPLGEMASSGQLASVKAAATATFTLCCWRPGPISSAPSCFVAGRPCTAVSWLLDPHFLLLQLIAFSLWMIRHLRTTNGVVISLSLHCL